MYAQIPLAYHNDIQASQISCIREKKQCANDTWNKAFLCIRASNSSVEFF